MRRFAAFGVLVAGLASLLVLGLGLRGGLSHERWRGDIADGGAEPWRLERESGARDRRDRRAGPSRSATSLPTPSARLVGGTGRAAARGDSVAERGASGESPARRDRDSGSGASDGGRSDAGRGRRGDRSDGDRSSGGTGDGARGLGSPGDGGGMAGGGGSGGDSGGNGGSGSGGRGSDAPVDGDAASEPMHRPASSAAATTAVKRRAHAGTRAKLLRARRLRARGHRSGRRTAPPILHAQPHGNAARAGEQGHAAARPGRAERPR